MVAMVTRMYPPVMATVPSMPNSSHLVCWRCIGEETCRYR